MKLHEIIKEISLLEDKKRVVVKGFDETIKSINGRMEELKRIEALAIGGSDIEKIQIAEKILNVYGNPDHNCEGRIITRLAAADIANDCVHLNTKQFSNKEYSGFYQGTDSGYGYGPSHGSNVDCIGLKDAFRNKPLSDEQKDACIYYLLNYPQIKKGRERV